MAKYLRKIFDQNVWTNLKYEYPNYEWLTSAKDIPAEPVVQLRPIKDNKLSLYFIQDDGSNLGQVLAAIGSRLIKLDVDYIILDISKLNERKFNIQNSKGTTLDKQVNKDWHFDANDVSGYTLVNLTKLFLDKGVSDTCTKYDLIEFINASIDARRIRWKSCSIEVKKYCPQVT